MKINNILSLALIVSLAWAGYACSDDEEVNYDLERPGIMLDESVFTSTITPGGNLLISGTATDNNGLESLRVMVEDWDIDTTISLSGTTNNINLSLVVPANVSLSNANMVQLMVSDLLGNIRTTEFKANFGADTEAPATTWSANQASEVFIGKNYAISGTVTDAFGIKQVTVSIPELSWSKTYAGNGSRSVSFQENVDIPTDFTTGSYNVVVTATDMNGNVSTDQMYAFEVQPLPYPTNLYLVGGSTSADWNPAASVPFVKLEDGKFRMYEYLTVEGSGFKFLEVQDWAGDWGADPDNDGGIVQDGEGNVTVPEDGFYQLDVDFVNSTYTVTKVEFGLIGSATTGSDNTGWNNDINLVGPTTKGDYSWTLTTDLFAGQAKFRANDSWDINFGDNEGDGIPDLNSGTNILVADAGNYTITFTLDPVNGYSYSFVKN